MEGRSSMKSMESPLALITGGAGFIGSNLAERLLSNPGMRVRIFDNLSRSGVVRNLEWLRQSAGQQGAARDHGRRRPRQRKPCAMPSGA